MVFACSADVTSVASQDTAARLQNIVRPRFVCADIFDDGRLPRACHVITYPHVLLGNELWRRSSTLRIEYLGTTSAVVVAVVIFRECPPGSHVCHSSLWGRSLAACVHTEVLSLKVVGRVFVPLASSCGDSHRVLSRMTQRLRYRRPNGLLNVVSSLDSSSSCTDQ